MVLETLDEDGPLAADGQELKTQAVEVLEVHFTGPECQGLCRGNPTASVVSQPLGRIAGDRGAPSSNTRIMMEQAESAADTIARIVSALFEGPVAEYREALRAAGYTPLDIPD